MKNVCVFVLGSGELLGGVVDGQVLQASEDRDGDLSEGSSSCDFVGFGARFQVDMVTHANGLQQLNSADVMATCREKILQRCQLNSLTAQVHPQQ